MGDPYYFHKGYDKSFFYKDKNGVYNGLRAEPFVSKPDPDIECLGHLKCKLNPESCGPAQSYWKQLTSLDFNEIYKRFENLAERIKTYEGFDEEPIMVLIVHEAPDNQCSERWAIKRWFKENGYNLEEFDKENF